MFEMERPNAVKLRPCFLPSCDGVTEAHQQQKSNPVEKECCEKGREKDKVVAKELGGGGGAVTC